MNTIAYAATIGAEHFCKGADRQDGISTQSREQVWCMADSVVGLMIDSDKIRAVELEKWRGNHPRAVRAGEVQLPPTAFVQGSVTDPEAISSAMKVLWRSEGFSSKRVIMSVDGRQAIVRRSELPAASGEALRRSAGFDIEELLSYPLDEAVFDVAEIGPSQKSSPALDSSPRPNEVDWVSTLVIAIHQSTRQSLLDCAVGAGLKPMALHLASESLTRSVHGQTQPGTASTKTALTNAAQAQPGEAQPGLSVSAIVSVCETQTDVVIRDASGTLFSRTLTVGIGESALNIADELESHLEGLSGYRSRSDGQTEAERRASAEQAGVSTVVEGVRRTLAYYQSELDNRGITQVSLVGSKAEAPGLQAALTSSLGAIVQPGEPQIQWLESLGHWHRYATALGAALCESRAGHQGHSFSLVPWEDQQRLETNRRRIVGVGVAVVLAAGLLNLSLSQRDSLAEQEIAANQAELARDAVANELASYDRYVAKVASLAAAETQAAAILSQDIPFPRVMQEVAEAMPTDSQLVSIQMRRAVSGEQILGYVGPSPAGVISMNALTTDISGVGLFVNNLSELQMSTGYWLNQSAVGPIGVSDEVGALFSLQGAITDASQRRTLSADSAQPLAQGGAGS